MKKYLSLALAIVLVLSMVACNSNEGGGTKNSGEGGGTKRNELLTFGTGDTGGSLYPAGSAISQVWNDKVEGVKSNVSTSTGSFQNVQDVNSKAVDVAVATADVVLNGYNGAGKFESVGKQDKVRVIGAVYTSVLSGVALKSSGLTMLNQLTGKRVAVGPAASATENASFDAFNVMGITKDNTSIENLGLGDGADAVGDGKLDAAFGFAGLPIGGQLNLATTKDIVVLGMTEEEISKVLAGNAAYIKAEIPAGTYECFKETVYTFGVKCLIIVNADMDEQLVYDLVKAMNENTQTMAEGNKLLKQMTDPKFLANEMPIPLHPGAERYYKEIGALEK